MKSGTLGFLTLLGCAVTGAMFGINVVAGIVFLVITFFLALAWVESFS